jgi:hypothetical protein
VKGVVLRTTGASLMGSNPILSINHFEGTLLFNP